MFKPCRFEKHVSKNYLKITTINYTHTFYYCW